MADIELFRLAQGLAEDLENRWGTGPRGMCGRHGPAARHFEVDVVSGRVTVRCLTSIAHGWHVIRRVAKRGYANVGTVEVVHAWSKERQRLEGVTLEMWEAANG